MNIFAHNEMQEPFYFAVRAEKGGLLFFFCCL